MTLESEHMIVHSAPPEKEQRRSMFTIRTIYAFIVLMVIVFGYYGLISFKTFAFSGFAMQHKPAFCPAGEWSNISTSINVFGTLYLNPLASYENLSVYAAGLCAHIENASSNAYIHSLTTINSSGGFGGAG